MNTTKKKKKKSPISVHIFSLPVAESASTTDHTFIFVSTLSHCLSSTPHQHGSPFSHCRRLLTFRLYCNPSSSRFVHK